MATGLVFDPIYLRHETHGHLENKYCLINTVGRKAVLRPGTLDLL